MGGSIKRLLPEKGPEAQEGKEGHSADKEIEACEVEIG